MRTASHSSQPIRELFSCVLVYEVYRLRVQRVSSLLSGCLLELGFEFEGAYRFALLAADLGVLRLEVFVLVADVNVECVRVLFDRLPCGFRVCGLEKGVGCRV